jgi:hypothetical protein
VCFQAANPGVSGTQVTNGHVCDGSGEQAVTVTGTGTEVAIQFGGANAGLCLARSGTYLTLETCSWGNAQIWDLEDVGGGLYTFHSRLDAACIQDTYFEGSGHLDRLRGTVCDGSARQQFSFA